MNWNLFVSTFSIIFIAELPDKTALATVMMATRGKPIPIFIGVALAFAVQSIVAVFLGSVIGQLPSRWVHLFTGILFLGFAILTWRKIDPKDDSKKEEITEKAISHPELQPRLDLSVIWSSFLVIFIAEWGDLTQLTTALLVARYHSKLTIFFAATLALWCVTAIAILIGHQSKKLVHPIVLQRISALVFACLGVYFFQDWLKGV